MAKSVRKKSTASRKAAPAKKAAARKTATKGNHAPSRNISRERIANLTKEVPEHQYFVLANGQPVKHVAELAAILDQLEDHVFNHHVTADRNDFHNWVRDVFQDVELARKISGVSDKKHLQLVIYKHLAGHD